MRISPGQPRTSWICPRHPAAVGEVQRVEPPGQHMVVEHVENDVAAEHTSEVHLPVLVCDTA